LLSIWFLKNMTVGIIILVIYLIYFGLRAGSYLLPNEKPPWQIFWGALSLVGVIIATLSIVYWFYEINNFIISGILIILPIIVSTISTHLPITNYQLLITNYFKKINFLALLIVFGDILLFSVLIARRTGDTLISPWTLFGPKFFLLFFLTSAMLIWLVQKIKSPKTNLFLIIFHYSLILTVALIVFKHGFGFDQIIHQTTEKWIGENGFIAPKQPYYIGQYMLVVVLNAITHLPIVFIDKILAPILSPIALSLIAYFSFSRNQQEEDLFPALAAIPLIPLTFFTFTTPNNLAMLFALLTFFWIWYEWKNHTNKTIIIGLILSLASIAIHPFVGLPALIIYLGSKIITKIKKYHHLFLISYFLFLILILPLTFLLNNLRSGQSFSIQNPFAHLAPFLNIFQKPHYYFLENAPLAWQFLYYYKFALMPIIVAVSIISFIIIWKKKKPSLVTLHSSLFYPITLISLLLSSLLLATTIQFPSVIGYEQNIFAKRLLELALIFLLPFFIIALQQFFIFLKNRSGWQLLASGLLAFALTLSFYFTYPTRDPVSLYTGYNVRDADIEAVHFIDKQNNGQNNYIVLTNQTVSAAALQEFGFGRYLPTPEGEQYFYSIPTGGPLYQYFRKMVYESPIKKHMVDAMNFAGVDTAYFVHTNYWAPAAQIRDAAKLEADNWWEIGGGRVWVYEYFRF